VDLQATESSIRSKEESKLLRTTPGAENSDVVVSKLKEELDRMAQQLSAEKLNSDADRQELLRLQKALQQMREADQGGQVQAVAPPLSDTVRTTNGDGDEESPGALGLLNSLGVVVGGAFGGYAFLLQNKAKSVEEQLSGELSGEQKLVAELKAQAQNVRARFISSFVFPAILTMGSIELIEMFILSVCCMSRSKPPWPRSRN
jgi:hypothetical protein